MGASPSYPLARERNLILASLLLLAAAAWAVLAWQHAAMSGGAHMGLTMGLSAPLFLAIWVVMMVAMMFPAAAPMILMFTLVHAGKRQRGQSVVPTWVFVSAYLLVWTLCGVLAYAAASGAEQLASRSMWLMSNGARLGGVVLIAAGLYQLSPLKRACLSKCRTPLGFLMGSWRDGYGGAFRMGLEHGAYCVGCCWLLFALLFPLGVMNVAVMALVTALIYAEKSLSRGRQISRLVAAALLAYGTLVVVVPTVLPTMM